MTIETSGVVNAEPQDVEVKVIDVLDSVDSQESPSKKTYADYVEELKPENKPTDETPKQEDTPSESELDKLQKSYDNLRRKFSQQGNELGELRKQFTDTLQRELSEQGPADNSSEPAKEITADDLLEEPAQAVSELLKQSPEYKEIQALRTEQKEQAKTAALDKQLTFLNDNYDGWDAAVKQEEFRDWASQNEHRITKFNKANGGDMDSLLDIVDAYHSAKPDNFTVDTAARQVEDTARNDKLKAATTGTSGAKGATQVEKFRRSDLVQLQIHNPGKYKSMLPRILKAYADGNVF